MSEKDFQQCGRPAIKKGLQFSLLAILCAASFPIAEAATVSLIPEQPSVSVGDTFLVDLNVAGLGANSAPSLGAFDITINFPTLFTFNNVTFGDPILGDQLSLLGSGSATATVPGLNNTELIEISFDSVAVLDSLQPSAFTLAVLSFTADSAGSGNMSLGNITLSDASGQPLSSTISNASIRVNGVSSVPEPATLLPLAGLLALMSIVTLRKRSYASARS